MTTGSIPTRPPQANRERVAVLAVLGAALLYKLVYLVYYAQQMPFYHLPMGDSLIYLDWARSIIGGDFWGTGEAFRVFYRAPLYPYLLAVLLKVFGGALLPVYLLQVLLGTLNLFLLYVITRRLFSHLAGLAAMALGGFYAALVFKETKLVAITLTITLLLLAVWLLLTAAGTRARWQWLAAGVCLGLASLTWGGVVAIVPIALLVWLALRPRPRFALFFLMVLGWFAAILPATLHNLLAGNDFVLINSNSGYTFYQGNNPAASGTIVHPPEVYERTYDGRFPTGIADQQYFDIGYASLVLKPVQPGQKQEMVKPSEASGFWLRRGLSWIAKNPGTYLRLEFQKLVLALGNYEFPSNYYLEVEQREVPVLKLAFVPFALLLGLGVLGMVYACRRWRGHWPLHLVIWTTFAILLVFYAGSRYRLPLILPLAAFAGAGLAQIADHWRHRRAGFVELIIVALVMVVSWVFCAVPLAKRYAFTTALGYRNLGEAQLAQGNPLRARRGLDKAVGIFEQHALFDRTTLATSALAEILALRGDVRLQERRADSAVADYHRALETDPRAAQPLAKLASAFFVSGTQFVPSGSVESRRLLDSALHYAEAWQTADTLSVQAQALAGDIQVARGDTTAALAAYQQFATRAGRGWQQALLAMAGLYLARRDTVQALAALDELLARDSTNLPAHLLKANVAAARQDSAGALAGYQLAGRLDTLAAEPTLRLGSYFAGRGDHLRAAATYATMVRRLEHNRRLLGEVLRSPAAGAYFETKLRWALALMNLRQWDEAREQIEGVRRVAPDHHTAVQLDAAVKERTVPKFIAW